MGHENYNGHHHYHHHNVGESIGADEDKNKAANH